MARPRKPKRDDLVPPSLPKEATSIPDKGRQPRIVGWLVLITGGFSSWYWYRPLPSSVNESVHATMPKDWPTSASGPKSLWSDSGLVLPSIGDNHDHGLEAKSRSPSLLSSESELVASPRVTLVPLTEKRQELLEVLKTERIPMVPVSPLPSLDKSATGPAPLWTQEDSETGGPSRATSSNVWPDVGYVPPEKTRRQQAKAATRITTRIPALLETGMKSIRTSEDLELGSNANHPGNESGAAPVDTHGIERTPQFIRQPKK